MTFANSLDQDEAPIKCGASSEIQTVLHSDNNINKIFNGNIERLQTKSKKQFKLCSSLPYVLDWMWKIFYLKCETINFYSILSCSTLISRHNKGFTHHYQGFASCTAISFASNFETWNHIDLIENSSKTTRALMRITETGSRSGTTLVAPDLEPNSFRIIFKKTSY